jgi:hypothetical protein
MAGAAVRPPANPGLTPWPQTESNHLDTEATGRRLVAFLARTHNAEPPHTAFAGQTPDEMYNGTGAQVPHDLAAARTTARAARLVANRAQACSTYPVPAHRSPEPATLRPEGSTAEPSSRFHRRSRRTFCRVPRHGPGDRPAVLPVHSRCARPPRHPPTAGLSPTSPTSLAPVSARSRALVTPALDCAEKQLRGSAPLRAGRCQRG